jgi:hypothetical protein
LNSGTALICEIDDDLILSAPFANLFPHDGSRLDFEKKQLTLEHDFGERKVGSSDLVEFRHIVTRISLWIMVQRRRVSGFDPSSLTPESEEALQMGRLTLEAAQELGDPVRIGKAFFWLGLTQYYCGFESEAVDSFQAAAEEESLPAEERGWVQPWIERATTTRAARSAISYLDAEELPSLSPVSPRPDSA